MSLLSESMEKFTMVDKTTQADGYGGVITVWKDGADIQAAIVLDSSMEARRAEKEGVTSLYTVITPRTVTLSHGDIIKRAANSKYYRITSDGTDKKTPGSAGLDMRAVSAEQLNGLPSGGTYG